MLTQITISLIRNTCEQVLIMLITIDLPYEIFGCLEEGFVVNSISNDEIEIGSFEEKSLTVIEFNTIGSISKHFPKMLFIFIFSKMLFLS